MPIGSLKFRERNIAVGTESVTIGRTSDNDVSFTDDSNVSRYHARLENRDGEFWIIDQDSSNGTTVNGTPVNGEMLLRDGDSIVLGGSSRIEFTVTEDEPEKSTEDAAEQPAEGESNAAETEESASTAGPEAASAGGSGSKKGLLLLAGAAVLLVGVLAIGGLGYYMLSGPPCSANVSFISPEKGATITGEKEVEISIEGGECVTEAIYFIDGKQVASTDVYPYGIKLNSNDHPELADALPHFLAVVVVDKDDVVVGQSPAIELAFETRRVAEPKEEIAENSGTDGDDGTGEKGQKETGASLVEVSNMTATLAGKVNAGGKFRYNIGNKQFLQEVQKMTAEYAQPGFFEKAAKYRDVINVAFVSENNIDASFGYILAMSRSKFDAAGSGNEQGLWRMSPEFVDSHKYNGLCGTETIADPSQNCAAKASAAYMKAIVHGVFGGDLVYSAAAFGKSPQEAVEWKATLPADRSDVWNAIRTPKEREQLVRFFAAALVAENPQKFGLNERPLSELYKLTL